jgi:hypothetical protein
MTTGTSTVQYSTPTSTSCSTGTSSRTTGSSTSTCGTQRYDVGISLFLLSGLLTALVLVLVPVPGTSTGTRLPLLPLVPVCSTLLVTP